MYTRKIRQSSESDVKRVNEKNKKKFAILYFIINVTMVKNTHAYCIFNMIQQYTYYYIYII